jgi:ATP-dependent Clp protease ATP-binding subunit ClpA
MFERFTDRARRVMVLAQEEARMLDHNYIGTEHILLGLLREEGVAAMALASLDIDLDHARGRVLEVVGRGDGPAAGHIPFTPRAKKVLELSLREALQLGHNYIGTEHILLGLIREGEGVAAQVLQNLGADLNRVRQTVIQLLSESKGEPQTSEMKQMEPEDVAREPLPTEPTEDFPTCPSCFASLAETLAVRSLEVTDDEEPVTVRIAYCGRCGIALGPVA